MALRGRGSARRPRRRGLAARPRPPYANSRKRARGSAGESAAATQPTPDGDAATRDQRRSGGVARSSPASTRSASATIGVRRSIADFWRSRNAVASVRPRRSIRSPFARSIVFRSSRASSERGRLAPRPRELREAGDRELDGRRELLLTERLHEVGHRARAARPSDHVRVRVARQHHDRARVSALDLGGGVDPVPVRQADRDHRRVRPLPGDQVEPRAGRVGLRHHGAPRARHRRPDERSRRDVIVDDHDPPARRGRGLAGGSLGGTPLGRPRRLVLERLGPAVRSWLSTRRRGRRCRSPGPVAVVDRLEVVVEVEDRDARRLVQPLAEVGRDEGERHRHATG